MPAWVYIMSNRRNGTLYIGVTANLAARVEQHRSGADPSFTHRYGLSQLVYAERHEEMLRAIQREKTMKHWPRAWKLTLITDQNPDWRDLYGSLSSEFWARPTPPSPSGPLISSPSGLTRGPTHPGAATGLHPNEPVG
jgi:putative endonuclease